MNAIYAAWLLLSLWLFTYAARVALADLREPRRDDDQQSWSIPEQRVSGRF